MLLFRLRLSHNSFDFAIDFWYNVDRHYTKGQHTTIMIQKRLHTPEGVRDIYNEECGQKLILQETLQRVLWQYGFSAIETPSFEFFDVFGQEIGTVPSKDLYKFFDREGNTLVLRPDITPSVARLAASYFSEDDMPKRLWYQGHVFINNSSYQGRLKETTQLGAELIGDDSIEADAELLVLAVRLLLAAGLTDFQLALGHVGFFRSLIQAADLDEDVTAEITALIENKNFFGVEEVLAPLSLPPALKELFGKLGGFYQNTDSLEKVKELAKDYPEVAKSIDRIAAVYEVLVLYGVEGHISIELSILSPYHYYTGIIFAGYTYGSGEAVVKGGRYDHLLSGFGKNAPSIGFAITIDQLMATLYRQKISLPGLQECRVIEYAPEELKDAIKQAEALRLQGESVLLQKR
ncbi:ATP phosphoribosyltransferase regulatory subunit [Clostridia bacterium]|nr:ATP phosphoribosyltransferase regulatory subunit [Clostridia bacterium]